MELLAGRYLLDKPIARGGMAVVHQARDEVLQRTVAVKTLTPDRATDQTFQTAVRREALAAARLNHRNIARVLDYGEAAWHGVRLPFLVMELVPGTTLLARLLENGPMPWREAAALCADVAAGLGAAHDIGLVHHDVKPANIMLSPRGAKVVDFGLATGPEDQHVSEGRIWGTPAYFSPEQLCGLPTGPASDIYALGLVLHACLTGRRAWPGHTAGEVLIARACAPVPRLPDSSDAPDPVRRIYRACLTRSPKKRPTAHSVARQLRCAARPAGGADRRHSRLRRLLGPCNLS
jgi:serine/threonine-protein kinase